MPKMIIAEEEENVADLLINRFEELGNEVTKTNIDNVEKIFEEEIPDVVLMDFSNDIKGSLEKSEKIVEFDHTACIFGMTTSHDKDIVDAMYKSGVRGVIYRPNTISSDNIDNLMDQIYESCNELEHEVCVGCWKTNKFSDLKPLV